MKSRYRNRNDKCFLIRYCQSQIYFAFRIKRPFKKVFPKDIERTVVSTLNAVALTVSFLCTTKKKKKKKKNIRWFLNLCYEYLITLSIFSLVSRTHMTPERQSPFKISSLYTMCGAQSVLTSIVQPHYPRHDISPSRNSPTPDWFIHQFLALFLNPKSHAKELPFGGIWFVSFWEGVPPTTVEPPTPKCNMDVVPNAWLSRVTRGVCGYGKPKSTCISPPSVRYIHEWTYSMTESTYKSWLDSAHAQGDMNLRILHMPKDTLFLETTHFNSVALRCLSVS